MRGRWEGERGGEGTRREGGGQGEKGGGGLERLSEGRSENDFLILPL